MASMSVTIGRRSDSRAVSSCSLSKPSSKPMVGIISSAAGGAASTFTS
jgi:hypothetical protein